MGPKPGGSVVIAPRKFWLFVLAFICLRANSATSAELAIYRFNLQGAPYKLAVIYHPNSELKGQALAETIRQTAMEFSLARYIEAGTFPIVSVGAIGPKMIEGVFDGRSALLVVAQDRRSRITDFPKEDIIATIGAAYLSDGSTQLPLQQRLVNSLTAEEAGIIAERIRAHRGIGATTVELKRLAITKNTPEEKLSFEQFAMGIMLTFAERFLLSKTALQTMGSTGDKPGILLETNPKGLARIYQRLGARPLLTVAEDPNLPGRGVAIMEVEPGVFTPIVEELGRSPGMQGARESWESLRLITDPEIESSNAQGALLQGTCQNLRANYGRTR